MFHPSFFYPLYRVVNPRFTRLIFLFALPPTNLVGVPALTYWYHHIHLVASPTNVELVPRCWSLVSALGSPLVPPLC
jgi:hypothetical protein